MKVVSKILAGSLGLTAIAVSAPAAAQYGGYPGSTYPGTGYGYPGTGNDVVGSILNSILGGRSYALIVRRIQWHRTLFHFERLSVDLRKTS